MSARRPHILSRNERTRVFSQMVFLDSESTVSEDKVHTPYLLVSRFVRFRDEKKSETTCIEWDTFDTFWDRLDTYPRAHSVCYVYAHNMGYDFTVLRGDREMVRRGWRAEPPFDSGPVFLIRYHKESRTIVFLSSTNYFMGSLKQLGKTFGLPKIEVDYRTITRAEAEPYALRDLDILEKAVLTFRSFVKENDLGNMSVTLAGQAFHAFQHRFMHHDIFINGVNGYDSEEARNVANSVVALERDCYYGGRVECFRLGTYNTHVYKLDVNSMYPAMMIDRPMPVKLRWARREPTRDVLTAWINEGYAICGRFLIETNEPCYPKLENGSLLYPIGTFIVNLSTPEIAYALAHDHIRGIEFCAVYETAVIFDTFVEFFYARKMNEHDPVLRYLYKIFLNALYGKMGQRSHLHEIITETDSEDFSVERVHNNETGEWYTIRRYGGIVSREIDGETPMECESYNSFPAIAAHVTAYARMQLWDYIQCAGQKNVYYCDTDSLFVDDEGLYNLNAFIDSTKLGNLKIEGDTYYLQLRNPKDYTFEGRTKRKGVNKDAVEIVPGTFRVEQWPSFVGSMYNPTVPYQNRMLDKRIDPHYKKAYVCADGSTVPLTYVDNRLQLSVNERFSNLDALYARFPRSML